MGCLVGLEQMQELNISGCTGIDATTVANVVAKNRTLSALIFGERMDEPATLEIGMTEAHFSYKNLGVGGAIIISAWITHKDKGAMASLDVSNNTLGSEGASIIAEALQTNTTLTSLNISSNYLAHSKPTVQDVGDMSGVIALTNAISDNGALLSLNLSKNQILSKESGKALAHALADAIPNMGALSVTNVLGNLIGKEQLTRLQAIMRSKPNLVSLCGIAGDATEADLSGLGMDADDAIVLASELPDKGAISKFDVSSNHLYAEGTKLLAAALKQTQTIIELNIANNDMTLIPGVRRGEMSGVIALVDAIGDMRAMTSLNLSANRLRAAGAKMVAEAIKVTKCTLAILLVPFSCPSDFSINCCCLLLSAGYEGIIKA
jgi:Ran GTPase-activating protein (RanGAP) involved in mRNA processing and transport